MKAMKTGLGFGVWGLLVMTLLCAGMQSWGQAALPKLTPEQALGNLDKASAQFKGTREDHVAIQQSLTTLAAVVRAYEQYESEVVSKRGGEIVGKAKKGKSPAGK